MSGENQNLMTQEELIHAVNGTLLDGFSGSFVCSSVVTDSRAVFAGALFIPLIGEKQDGHAYIGQAIEKGATVIFVAASE